MVPTDPLTAEYLTRKPSAENTSLTRGDLAPSSIFESDEADPKPLHTPSPTPTTPSTQRARDPANMAAALDPDPDARKRWQRKMVIRDIRGRHRLSKTEKIMRTERQSVSKSHMLKTSVKKLGPLARQIAGKPIEAAIVQMRFSKKLAAREVKLHLEHARNEAIVRRGMGLGEVEGTRGEGKVHIELKNGKKKIVHDRTGIYVDQAWVGRGKYGREPDYRARGQINVMWPPYTSELFLPPPPSPWVDSWDLIVLTGTRHHRTPQGRGYTDPSARGEGAETAEETGLGAVAEQTHHRTETVLLMVD